MVLGWLPGAPSTPRGDTGSNLFVRLYNSDVYPDSAINMYEPPETPAHLFPLRAFKQAIFGTPKIIEPTPRQPVQSNTASIKPTKTCAPPTRRGPSTYEDSRKQIDNQTSPTKRGGILLTPGAGGQRQKSVTFRDGFGKRDNGSMSSREAFGGKANDPNPETGPYSLQTNLNNIPHDQFNRSTEVKADPDDLTLDLTEPRSASGRYWKREYEAQSEKARVQLKQLSKKEQIARQFAKLKDAETQQLRIRLEQETSKVASLEEKLSAYIDQLSQTSCDITKMPSGFSQSEKGVSGQDSPLLAASRETKEPLQQQSHYQLPSSTQTLNKTSSGKFQSSDTSSFNSQHGGSCLQGRLFLSSDIWADACVNEKTDSHPQAGLKSECIVTDECHPHCQPLGKKSRNPKSTFDNPKESSLSMEKRKAARRRLEEKRLARIRDSIPHESVN